MIQEIPTPSAPHDESPPSFPDEAPDRFLRPFVTTVWAIVLSMVGCLVFLALSALMADGTPPWPPSSQVDFVAYLFLVLVPTQLVFGYGWSYSLQGGELVLYRFGRERERHMLAGFRGTHTQMGSVTLDFRHGRVPLVSMPTEARLEFLTELKMRAEALGAQGRLTVKRTDAEHIAVPVALVRFPNACVRCAQPVKALVPLTAQRGVSLIVFNSVAVTTIPVPVCDAHDRAFHRMKRMTRMGFIPFWLVFVMILRAFGAVWSGAVLLGALPVAALYPILYIHVLRPMRDWRVLRIRSTHLSKDLSEVTLRFARPDLLEEVLARAASASPTHSPEYPSAVVLRSPQR